MASGNNLKTPPAPKGHWLWGHSKNIIKDPLRYPVEAALNYKPICRLQLGIMTIYVTANVDCIKQVFLSHTENFVKGPGYKTLSFLGGNGLLSSEGDFWKKQRRLAQPAFHKDKLKGFLQTFIDCSNDIAIKWQQYDKGEVYPISQEMGELTLRITGKTLFGIDLYKEAASVPNDVKSTLLFLNKRIYGFPKYPIRWPLHSHTEFYRHKKRLDKVIYKIIDERIMGHTSGDDLLQTFLDTTDAETGEKMSREHLRDEVMTLFLAGYETSSVALAWVWYVLWKHEKVRTKFINELNSVIGDGAVKPEHIMQLAYTKSIVEETLRLYPPAYNLPRQLVKDMEMEGYRLKRGSIVLTSIFALHRNPDYWPNPETFDPDRFNNTNADKIVKASYMPFGLGQRICIGNNFALLEIVAVMAVLGRKFILTPQEGYEPHMIPSITTNIFKGMPMHIHCTM